MRAKRLLLSEAHAYEQVRNLGAKEAVAIVYLIDFGSIVSRVCQKRTPMPVQSETQVVCGVAQNIGELEEVLRVASSVVAHHQHTSGRINLGHFPHLRKAQKSGWLI